MTLRILFKFINFFSVYVLFLAYVQGKCNDCSPNSAVANEDCKRCDATNTFACTGPSTYALCLGTKTPSQSEGSCQQNHVCNRNSRYICEDSRIGGVATCPSTVIPTSTPRTTPPTGLDPVHFCKAKQQFGRFRVGLEADPTCKQYFMCFIGSGGLWNGQLHTCPDGTYFERSIALCDFKIPVDC